MRIALFVLVVGFTCSAWGDDLAPQPKGGFRPKATGVYRDKLTPYWFANETKVWYRKDLKGGTKEFILVDAEKGTRAKAFDHAKLAAGLSKATEKEHKADRLPFEEVNFTDDLKFAYVDVGGRWWKFDLDSYACINSGAAPKKDPEPA